MTEANPRKPVFDHSEKVLPGAIGTLHHNPVTLHTFSPRVEIPTTKISSYFLLKKILCEAHPVLVSPAGEVAGDHWGVKEAEGYLVGGCVTRFGDTDYRGVREGSMVREWMTGVPRFIEELTENGWFYFEGADLLDADEREEEGLSKHSTFFRRPLKLESVLNVLRLNATEEDANRYALPIADLQELVPYFGDARLIYELGNRLRPKHLIRGSAKLGERSARLDLTELKHLYDPIVESDSHRSPFDKPDTMMRTASVFVPIRSGRDDYSVELPHWWTQDTSARVDDLANKFISGKGLEFAKANRDNAMYVISIDIGSKYVGPITAPDTGKLLSNVIEVGDFVKRAIGLEYESHSETEEGILDRRIRQLGLNEIVNP